MSDIVYGTNVGHELLDTLARGVMGVAISGVSNGPYGSIIHVTNETQANENKAQAIFDNWDGLTVTAVPTTLTEGDPDPIVTCADVQILADSDVGYVVLWDGNIYDSGTDTVIAGVVTLTLASPAAGVYDVYVYRLSGNYASGFVQITVNEA